MEDLNSNIFPEPQGSLSEDFTPPPAHTSRRKSSRRSILPIACPLDQTQDSPVNTKSALQIPASNEQVSGSPHHSEVGNPCNSPDTSPTVECTDSLDLVNHYIQEMENWKKLLQCFQAKLNHSPNTKDLMPSVQLVREDRIISHYREILLPLCEGNATSINESPYSINNLTQLHRKILFDLSCLPEILERQCGLLKSLRQCIQLNWSIEQQTFEVNHQNIDSLMEDFLSA